MTTKETTNVLTAKETLVLVLEIVRYGRKKKIIKLKHPQNITYPEARRMIDSKICGSDKKYPNKPKTKLLCVKQMQAQNSRWLPSL